MTLVMDIMKKTTIPLLIAISSTLFGGLGLSQWSIYSEHRLLENKAIVAVVEIEQVLGAST